MDLKVTGEYAMNEFDFGGQAAWGGAGVALGLGLAEAQEARRRHNELLAAVQSGNKFNAQVAELDAQRLAAESLLLRARKNAQLKDQQIEHLEALISIYQGIDNCRVAAISTLRESLSKYDESIQQLVARMTGIIEKRQRLSDEKDGLLELMNQRIEKKDEEMGLHRERIALLQAQIVNLQSRVDLQSSRVGRYKKLHEDAEARVREVERHISAGQPGSEE